MYQIPSNVRESRDSNITYATYHSVRYFRENAVSRAFLYHVMYGKKEISPQMQSLCGKLSSFPHNITGSR